MNAEKRQISPNSSEKVALVSEARDTQAKVFGRVQRLFEDTEDLFPR